MKAVLKVMFAAAILATKALATPTPEPFECLIECIEPDQHDPLAAASCNCAERYCPPPTGPGGPNIPVGDVWGWNESTDSCGPVPEGEQCAGLDVTCVSGYSYGWNKADTTCQCLPISTKRQICDIVCVPPEAYDPHAVTPECNCAERVCKPISCPEGQSVGWDQGECGCVASPEAACVALDVSCVPGYTYGWNASITTCQCLAN